MATTIPKLPVFTGKTPVIGQAQPEFNINRADKLAYDAQLFGEEGAEGALNTTIEAINTASSEIESNAASAEASVRRFNQVEQMRSATANLIDSNLLLDGYYLENTGLLVPISGYSVSDFIKVDEGITYKVYKSDGSGGAEVGQLRKTCYFNGNYSVVSGGSSATVNEFTVPVGVKYVRVTVFNSDTQTTLVDDSQFSNPTVDDYLPLLVKNEDEVVARKLLTPVILREGNNSDSAISHGSVSNKLSSALDNVFGYGDFISGNPTVRTGSSVTSVIGNTSFAEIGLCKAINQRTDGNEFILSKNLGDISGKYVRACFYVQSANQSNLNQLVGATCFSFTAGGTLQALSGLSSGKVSITDDMLLVWAYGMIPSNSVGLALGTSTTPLDNTVYMSGFFAVIDDEESNIQSLLDYVSLVSKGRQSALKYTQYGVNAELNSYMEIAGSDNPVNINGLKSKRTVLPFKSKDLISSSGVFNFKDDYVGGVLLRQDTIDDVAPIHAYGSTMMANHSYNGCQYVATSHGKTNDDIGSVYTDGVRQFVLIRVIDGDSLFVADTLSNSDLYPTNSTLTYISGGVTTTDIIVGSKTYRQMYPCYTDYKMVITVDDKPISSNSGIYNYVKWVSFSESYGLLSRQSLIDWYINNGDDSLNPIGSPALHQSMSYDFDFDGNCTISGNYTALDSVSVQDFMALQAIKGSSTSYYIPKTVEFSQAGQTLNFSMIEPSNVVSSNAVGNVFFTPEKLDSSTIPSDRWLQISNNGVFAMGFLPTGSAGINRAANVTDFAAEIRGNTDKVYPRLVDVGNFTSTIGQSWDFAAYRIVHIPQAGATASYPVRTRGDDYFYLDYHDTQELVKIEMPSDYIGRQFEVVESRNIATQGLLITSEMYFNVQCSGDYGYLVLRVKK